MTGKHVKAAACAALKSDTITSRERVVRYAQEASWREDTRRSDLSDCWTGYEAKTISELHGGIGREAY